MATISATLGVQVKQGPQVSIPPIEMQVEAYDKIEVSVDSGADIEVDIQPGDSGVSFLLVVSSVYTPPGAPDDQKLTYVPEGKEPISLDSPQLYLGSSSISTLIGAVKKITFFNNLLSPESDQEPPKADISILVGRDATPSN